MNNKRLFFFMSVVFLSATVGFAFTRVDLRDFTAFVSFASNTPNDSIITEANYILSCQAPSGAINNVFGDPTWVKPRENGTAAVGLMEAYSATNNSAYKDGALKCLDYLKGRQEADGGWSAHYNEMINARVDRATTPSEAGSVIMAMYKAKSLGWEDPAHQYYESAKAAGAFIIECITQAGGSTGLAGAGKDYNTSTPTTSDERGAYKWSDWCWVSDNSYAYLGLLSLREWAVQNGDYDFARTCNQYLVGIYTGINAYLKNPSNAVWYPVVDSNGNLVSHSNKVEALCYYPQKYDIPVPQYRSENIAQWMVSNLQVTDTSVSVPRGYGAFIWRDAEGGDGYHPYRRSQGYSMEAWLALVDIPGAVALDARTRAQAWWESPDNTNGIITVAAPVSYQLWDVIYGGIRDWYDPDTETVASPADKFIDTSANCIHVYRGGYDYTSGIPYVTAAQPPQIAHAQIAQVSPINAVVTASGTVTASAPLRFMTMSYFTDIASATTTVTANLSGALSSPFSLSASPALAGAASFYYVLQAVDAVGNIARLPAVGHFVVPVANAAASEIGPAGGTITLAEGNAFGGYTSITIPPNSLDDPQMITVAEVQPEEVGIMPPSGQYTLGVDIPVVMYQFTPKGLTFDPPATITLLYPDVDNDNIVDGTAMLADELVLLWWNESYQRWETIGGVVDTSLKTVTCPITHFSIYGLGFKAIGKDSDYRPLEKIITPATADTLFDAAGFHGLGLEDTVTIFNVAGRKIRELRSQAGEQVVWDGRDSSGAIVESGIYIYQIKLRDKSKPISGTIVVAK